MRSLSRIGVLLAACLVAASASAQRRASTVQLPTFSSFGVSTTVSVPDSGGGLLGGLGRAQSGIDEFGGAPYLPLPALRNASLTNSLGGSGAYVRATIHDMRQLDQWVLSQPITHYGLPAELSMGSPLSGTPHLWSRERESRCVNNFGLAWVAPLPSGGEDGPAATIEQIRSERRQQRLARQTEAEDLFERGQIAESAGKKGAARIYYQMAARRADGELKARTMARLAAIATPAVSPPSAPQTRLTPSQPAP
jgi:hypothetical protein